MCFNKPPGASFLGRVRGLFLLPQRLTAGCWRNNLAAMDTPHSDALEHPQAGEPVIDRFFYLPPALDVTRGNTDFVVPKFYNFITYRGETRYLPEEYDYYKDIWDAWEQSESPNTARVWEAYSAFLATPAEPEPPEHEAPEE